MMLPVFYKEYLKTRFIWTALLLVNLAVMIYIAADTRHLFIMDHPEMVWHRLMYLGSVHFGVMKFLPTVTGVLLSVAQFLPEMRDERFRLSLHLPVEIHSAVMAHVAFGMVAAAGIILLDMGLLAYITALYFPVEAVSLSIKTAAPWCSAGFVVYLGVALVLLEPLYPLKAALTAMAAATAGLFLHRATPGAYGPVMVRLLLLSALLIPGVLLPAYRFRFRRIS